MPAVLSSAPEQGACLHQSSTNSFASQAYGAANLAAMQAALTKIRDDPRGDLAVCGAAVCTSLDLTMLAALTESLEEPTSGSSTHALGKKVSTAALLVATPERCCMHDGAQAATLAITNLRLKGRKSRWAPCDAVGCTEQTTDAAARWQSTTGHWLW